MKISILNGPKNKPNEYPMEKSVVAIGRDKAWADLPLPWDGYVSSKHARLIYEEGVYWLEDVGSRHGTFIDGVKISRKTQLKESVEFQLGTTILRLEADGRPDPEIPFVHTMSASMNAPMLSSLSSSLKTSVRESLRPIEVEVEAPLVSPLVKIIVLQGDYLEHKFEKSPITIGRLIENDLVLYDPRVSRQHAQLFFQGGQWHLMDLRSLNGTFLNGAKLKPKTPVPLSIGAAITVARIIDLKLDHGDLLFVDEPQLAFIHTEFVPHLAAEGLLNQLKQTEDDKDKVELLKKRLAFPQWRDILVIAYQLCATKYKMRINFVDWICGVLSVDDAEIRANAADVLGQFGDKKAIAPLELLLDDKEKQVRAQAALALGELEAEQTVSKLLDLFKHDPSRRVQLAAALSLIYINHISQKPGKVLSLIHLTELRQFIAEFSLSPAQVTGQIRTHFDSTSSEE